MKIRNSPCFPECYYHGNLHPSFAVPDVIYFSGADILSENLRITVVYYSCKGEVFTCRTVGFVHLAFYMKPVVAFGYCRCRWSWQCCLNLEVVISTPTGSTIIYRFLRGFIWVSLCQTIGIIPTNICVNYQIVLLISSLIDLYIQFHF